MMFLYLLLALLGVGGLVAAIISVGGFSRIVALKNFSKATAAAIWQFAVATYYDHVVPAARTFAIVGIAFFALGGIGASVLTWASKDVPSWVGVFSLGLSLVAMACLFIARRPLPHCDGRKQVTGKANIAFPEWFRAHTADHTPIIRVETSNSDFVCAITDVTQRRFSVEITPADDPEEGAPVVEAPKVLVRWSARARPAKDPVLKIVFWTAIPAIVLGLVYVCLAYTYHNPLFIWLAMPFTALAVGIAALAYAILETTETAAASAAEYVPNGVATLMSAIVTGNREKLVEAFKAVTSDKQAMSFFTQEAWKKNRNKRIAATVVYLIAFFTLALVFPLDWKWFLGFRLLELVVFGNDVLIGYLADKNAEEAKVSKDASEAEKRLSEKAWKRVEFLREWRGRARIASLATYVSIVTVMTILVMVGTIDPDFKSAFETRSTETWSLVPAFLRGEGAISFFDWRTALAGLAFFGVGFLWIFPWKKTDKDGNPVKDKDGNEIEPQAKRTRQMVAVPFGLVAAVCLLGLGASILSRHAKGDAIAIDGLRTSQMHAPTVKVADGKLTFDWEKAPNASDYRIEWREVEDLKYQKLATGFDKQVTHWVGKVPAAKIVDGEAETFDAKGKTLEFRIVALYPKSAAEPSADAEVKMPGGATPPAGTGSVSGKPNGSPQPPFVPSKPATKPAATVVEIPVPTTSPCSGSACDTKEGPAMAQLRKEMAEDGN